MRQDYRTREITGSRCGTRYIYIFIIYINIYIYLGWEGGRARVGRWQGGKVAEPRGEEEMRIKKGRGGSMSKAFQAPVL